MNDEEKFQRDRLRQRAQAYREKAEAASLKAWHAADHAPGSFVTGRSGRSRAMNRKTERALERTIEQAMQAIRFQKIAARLEAKARWLEGEEDRAAKKERQKAMAALERKERKKWTQAQRLFIGKYPAGIVYADRAREKNGDYVRLGFMSYGTLELALEKDCPAEMAQVIREHATSMQSRKGERFQISMCGQCVVLGNG